MLRDDFDVNKCPLCSFDATWNYDRMLAEQDLTCPVKVNCGRCGVYSVTSGCLYTLKPYPGKPLISGLAREYTIRRQMLEITKANLRGLESLAPKSVSEKAKRFLQNIELMTTSPGEWVHLHDEQDYSLAYVINGGSFMFLIYELRAAGLIELAQVKDNLRLTGMRITLNGWKALEGYRVPNSQSSKAFLAMCFAEELRPISENGLEAGIKDAGYDAIRVDKREHTDKIDDLIIAEIKESRFVVADFTKQRGGVYFEAGFAKGLGLPVIWTCRQDDIENLHFDTRQYNTIVWSEAKDLRRRLAVRIRAVVGTGPKQDAKSIHLTTT